MKGPGQTAPSSNSSLYHKSPLHCPTESLCLHASLVHIDCPTGSRTEPAIWFLVCHRSAAGLVATIAKTETAIGTIPSVHHAALKSRVLASGSTTILPERASLNCWGGGAPRPVGKVLLADSLKALSSSDHVEVDTGAEKTTATLTAKKAFPNSWANDSGGDARWTINSLGAVRTETVHDSFGTRELEWCDNDWFGDEMQYHHCNRTW